MMLAFVCFGGLFYVLVCCYWLLLSVVGVAGAVVCDFVFALIALCLFELVWTLGVCMFGLFICVVCQACCLALGFCFLDYFIWFVWIGLIVVCLLVLLNCIGVLLCCLVCCLW